MCAPLTGYSRKTLSGKGRGRAYVVPMLLFLASRPTIQPTKQPTNQATNRPQHHSTKSVVQEWSRLKMKRNETTHEKKELSKATLILFSIWWWLSCWTTWFHPLFLCTFVLCCLLSWLGRFLYTYPFTCLYARQCKKNTTTKHAKHQQTKTVQMYLKKNVQLDFCVKKSFQGL